jgi:hypothetical protein
MATTMREATREVTTTREAATTRETTTNYSKKQNITTKKKKASSSSKEQKLGRMETKKTNPQINMKSVIKSVTFYVKFLGAVCVLISGNSRV